MGITSSQKFHPQVDTRCAPVLTVNREDDKRKNEALVMNFANAGQL